MLIKCLFYAVHIFGVRPKCPKMILKKPPQKNSSQISSDVHNIIKQGWAVQPQSIA